MDESAAVGAFLPSGETGNKAKALVLIVVVVLVIVVGTVIFKKYIGTFDKIMQFLGLEDSPEKKAAKDAINNAISDNSNPGSPWNPDFYKTAPADTALITRANADTIASQLWNSVGVLYDDPEQGLAAIKQLNSQAKVSWLVDVFNMNYQRDLLDWLRQKYDTTSQVLTLKQIVDYVANLKKY